MTQLLISVNNVEEALSALQAGADIIDLKDPRNGALGALDIATSAQIIRAIDGRVTLSATVGEQHKSIYELVDAIYSYHKIGTEIIKLAVNESFADPDFETEISKITAKNIKLVAVFFADKAIDLMQLNRISALGFFGAMLDTKQKQWGLTQLITEKSLQRFAQACVANRLKYGFAGSLRAQQVDQLIVFNPAYLGFRGGVCEGFDRGLILVPQKVKDIKKLLFKHNNLKCNVQNMR